MKPDIAKRWCEALRSGEFKQNTSCALLLPETQEYCCLGVLCELHRREFGGEWTDGNTTYLKENAVLPPAVLDWSGIAERFGDYGGAISLTRANDRGTPFSEIADIIEQNVEAL